MRTNQIKQIKKNKRTDLLFNLILDNNKFQKYSNNIKCKNQKKLVPPPLLFSEILPATNIRYFVS